MKLRFLILCLIPLLSWDHLQAEEPKNEAPTITVPAETPAPAAEVVPNSPSETPNPTEEVAGPEEKGPGVLSVIWKFLNSELGTTVIGGIILFLLVRLFAWKPKWKKYFDEYKPMLIQAVKYAEKKIPDDTENVGLKRADEALKYLLGLDASLQGKLDTTELKKALAAAHAEAESSGNLGN